MEEVELLRLGSCKFFVALLVLLTQGGPLLGNLSLLGEEVGIAVNRSRILVIGVVVGLILRLLSRLFRLLGLLSGELGLLLPSTNEGRTQGHKGRDNDTNRACHCGKGSLDHREHRQELTSYDEHWSDGRSKRGNNNDNLLRRWTQILKPGRKI